MLCMAELYAPTQTLIPLAQVPVLSSWGYGLHPDPAKAPGPAA